YRPCASKESGLDENLADQRPAARAERGANGQFAATADPPREEKAGNVDARDEQYEGDDGHRYFRGELKFIAHRREPVRRGFDHEAGHILFFFNGWQRRIANRLLINRGERHASVLE